MKLLTLSLVCAALAGCASQPPRVETVQVKVPVPTPCISAEDVPARPQSAFDATTDKTPITDQVKALLTDRERFQLNYTPKLQALVGACIK